MTEDGPAADARGAPRSPARRRRVALAALLLLAGVVIGFTARCAVAALFVNVGSLAGLHGADDLAASAFELATSVDPTTQAATNFRISQALLHGDYNAAADQLVALRAAGGEPRGAAATSSVLAHLDAVLANRNGDSDRALSLIRESVIRAGDNAPAPALRLLDQLTREAAIKPYAPGLDLVRFPVDPRRNTCGDGRQLARARLNRNEVAAGGPLRVELDWTDAAGRQVGRDRHGLRNLAPNGGFVWGRGSADLPLGYVADPETRASAGIPAGDIALAFADLDGRPVSALVIDNLAGLPRTSRLRSDWIPATAGACYLLASEVWVNGGQPHFGLYLRAPGRAESTLFGLQGGLPDGWRREARLVRLPQDVHQVQIFFWNFRSAGATAFSLALVARIDG